MIKSTNNYLKGCLKTVAGRKLGMNSSGETNETFLVSDKHWLKTFATTNCRNGSKAPKTNIFNLLTIRYNEEGEYLADHLHISGISEEEQHLLPILVF